MEELTIKIGSTEYKLMVDEISDGKLKVHFDNETFEVETKSQIEKQLQEELGKKDAKTDKEVRAPLPGIIYSIHTKTGEKVKKGQKLISLMAMKMENEIESPVDGKIKEIKAKKNDNVNKGDVLIVFE